MDKLESNELLARIDERTMRSEKDLVELKESFKKEMSDLRESLQKEYVTSKEFLPVRNIVYGMVSVILVAVLTGVIALVVRAGN